MHNLSPMVPIDVEALVSLGFHRHSIADTFHDPQHMWTAFYFMLMDSSAYLKEIDIYPVAILNSSF